MIALDEDALICDFAETYHIYDLFSLPVEYAAILACGLRDDSRIKMKAVGLEIDLKSLLLAHIADNTIMNCYLKTKDAQKGTNTPASFVRLLTEKKDPSKEIRKFDSGADFDKEWEKLNV